MPITYTRIHSDVAIANQIKYAQPSIKIATGMKRLVRVKFPTQGRLNDVSVLQTGGTPVAFTADILKSKAPFPPDTDVALATVPNVPLEQYAVLDTIVVPVPGDPAGVPDDNIGFAFRNVDGGYTLNQRYIYVLITPAVAGDTTSWDILLTCESDVGL